MGTENFAEALRGCEKELAIFGLNRRLLMAGIGLAYRAGISRLVNLPVGGWAVVKSEGARISAFSEAR